MLEKNFRLHFEKFKKIVHNKLKTHENLPRVGRRVVRHQMKINNGNSPMQRSSNAACRDLKRVILGISDNRGTFENVKKRSYMVLNGREIPKFWIIILTIQDSNNTKTGILYFSCQCLQNTATYYNILSFVDCRS